MIGALPTAIEVALSWAVREGVTNVIRHSRARQCVIRVTRDTNNACVEIADDGVAAVSSSAKNQGNGLRGLAERVVALGGQCETGPRSSGGFRVAVSVPLSQRNHLAGMIDVTEALRIPEEIVRTSGSEERGKQV